MNNMVQENGEKKQAVIVRDRNHLEVNGVKDVSGFDAGAVILHTVFGGMTVEGDALHITRLDLDRGEVALDGRIDAVMYTDTAGGEKKTGFFSRLVR